MESLCLNVDGEDIGCKVVRAKDFTDSRSVPRTVPVGKATFIEKQLKSAFKGSVVAELLDDIITLAKYSDEIRHRAILVKKLIGE